MAYHRSFYLLEALVSNQTSQDILVCSGNATSLRSMLCFCAHGAERESVAVCKLYIQHNSDSQPEYTARVIHKIRHAMRRGGTVGV